MSEVRNAFDRFPPVEEVTSRLTQKIFEVSEPEEDLAPEEGRVKTRFLNFRFSDRSGSEEASYTPPPRRRRVRTVSRDLAPIGRLTVVEGAGRGADFPLTKQFVQIGRGEDQDIQLAFGDTSVSRDGHASIAYYGKQIGFLIRDGRKPNPVLLNGMVLQGEDCLRDGDEIRVGDTTLQFTQA